MPAKEAPPITTNDVSAPVASSNGEDMFIYKYVSNCDDVNYFCPNGAWCTIFVDQRKNAGLFSVNNR
jgi:hypothetical protein